jgi:hypothetical protein
MEMLVSNSWETLEETEQKALVIVLILLRGRSRFLWIILLQYTGTEVHAKMKNTEPKRTVNFLYSEIDH